MAGPDTTAVAGPIGPREPVDVLLQPFRRFANFEAAGGVLLLAATVVALTWANSPLAESYTGLWEGTTLSVAVGEFKIAKPLVVWINDLLMAVFFLLVGLEIKREMLVGELASPRRAAVPIFAAIGGMAVPGAIYAAFNLGTPEVRGWGIPMATDIAFALGVLALLGRRIPVGLRVFLASLAIIDDLGALLVIAMFYTSEIHAGHLAWAGAGVAGLAALNALGARRVLVYALIGLFIWYHLLKSGVHPTIAGVLTAMTIPARSRIDGEEFLRGSRAALDRFETGGPSGRRIITNTGQVAAVEAVQLYSTLAETPLQRLEHNLLPWVSFLIVPVFALANAGVSVSAGGGPLGVVSDPVALGIGAGLVLGKPIGILLATWIAVRTGLGALPTGVTWRHLVGAGFLAGIGFTMSLFIAALAFSDPGALAVAKAGVLGASLIAGVVGFGLLRGIPVPRPGTGAAEETGMRA